MVGSSELPWPGWAEVPMVLKSLPHFTTTYAEVDVVTNYYTSISILKSCFNRSNVAIPNVSLFATPCAMDFLLSVHLEQDALCACWEPGIQHDSALGVFGVGQWLQRCCYLRCFEFAITGWWFGTIFIFPYIWNNHPKWLIFFRGVETTNQYTFTHTYIYK